MRRDPGLIPLSRDHQHALSLCVLADRALAAGSPTGEFPAQARNIARKFDEEMRAHFDFEERVLFPALAPFPQLAPLIAELLDDHRQLIGLVDTLRTSSRRAPIEQFSTLLEQHVRKEERSLFEQAQQLLSREELNRIGGL